MTDSGSQDHWKSIADLLGTPSSRESEPPRPTVARQPPVEQSPREKEAKPAPPKRKNHWGFVLSEVGLAPQPVEEPVQPAPEVAPRQTAPTTSAAKAPSVQSRAEPSWQDIESESSEDLIEDDPLVMPTESVFDEVASPILTDEVEDFPPLDAESQVTTSDSEEPRRRRRRRRRGRRRPEESTDARGTEDSLSTPATAGPEIVADAVTDIADSDDADWEESTEPKADSESEERPRRRRRRRRGRRDRAEGRTETTDTATSPAGDESSDDDDEPEVILQDDGDDHEDSDDVADGASDSPSHRKIPTWREAIGVLVDVNLANHTKTKPFRGGGGGRRRPN